MLLTLEIRHTAHGPRFDVFTLNKQLCASTSAAEAWLAINPQSKADSEKAQACNLWRFFGLTHPRILGDILVRNGISKPTIAC